MNESARLCTRDSAPGMVCIDDPGDPYDRCGLFSVSEGLAKQIIHRWNGFADMQAAKDKALEALKRLVNDGGWIQVDTGIGMMPESSPARKAAKRLIAELESMR